MRTPRTEIISVDTDRLARHAFHHHVYQADLVRFASEPLANGRFKLTIHPISELQAADGDQEFWRRTDVDRLLRKMVTLEGRPWTATLVEGSVLLETSGGVDAVIAECVRWMDIRPRFVSRAEIDAMIASVKTEIHRLLVQWQVTGKMKTLNLEYKRLRTSPRAEGEKFPSLKTWLTAQLERQLVLQLVPAGL